MDLKDWRLDYNKYNLKEEDLPSEPFSLFKEWFEKASTDQNPEPNAMILSTSAPTPNARVVLLKELKDDSFVFFTNYNSAKGQEIDKNNDVSLLFFWPMSQRQVRICGKAAKISRERSEAYFSTRPIESQISAISSPQSQEIKGEELLKRIEEIKEQNNIECPPFWGGYAVIPSSIEFWQGQMGRLHDRWRFKKSSANLWEISRLAP
jgi:pyridoxamine 5'-phosphate oxidase